MRAWPEEPYKNYTYASTLETPTQAVVAERLEQETLLANSRVLGKKCLFADNVSLVSFESSSLSNYDDESIEEEQNDENAAVAEEKYLSDDDENAEEETIDENAADTTETEYDESSESEKSDEDRERHANDRVDEADYTRQTSFCSPDSEDHADPADTQESVEVGSASQAAVAEDKEEEAPKRKKQKRAAVAENKVVSLTPRVRESQGKSRKDARARSLVTKDSECRTPDSSPRRSRSRGKKKDCDV